MDSKAIGFIAITLAVVVGSFLLLYQSKQGLKAFFIVLGILLTINMLHLAYVLNLPPKSGWGNLGAAVGYVILTLVEEAGMLLFSLIWFIVERQGKKSGS